MEKDVRMNVQHYFFKNQTETDCEGKGIKTAAIDMKSFRANSMIRKLMGKSL